MCKLLNYYSGVFLALIYKKIMVAKPSLFNNVTLLGIEGGQKFTLQCI